MKKNDWISLGPLVEGNLKIDGIGSGDPVFERCRSYLTVRFDEILDKLERIRSNAEFDPKMHKKLVQSMDIITQLKTEGLTKQHFLSLNEGGKTSEEKNKEGISRSLDEFNTDLKKYSLVLESNLAEKSQTDTKNPEHFVKLIKILDQINTIQNGINFIADHECGRFHRIVLKKDLQQAIIWVDKVKMEFLNTLKIIREKNKI